MTERDPRVGIAYRYMVDLGSQESKKMIEEEFKRKEKCINKKEMEDLKKHLDAVIKILKEDGDYLPTVFVLEALQVDNLYCLGGHSHKSGRNVGEGEDANDYLEKAQEGGQNLVKSYEKSKSNGTGKQMYLFQMQLAGVWVYGIAAMASVTSKSFGEANKLLRKAENCLEQIHPKALEDAIVAEKHNVLLESAYLNNCFGRYSRDYQQSLNNPLGIDEALRRFERAGEMYKKLGECLGGNHYLRHVIFMKVNCIRTYLGPVGKDSWGERMDERSLSSVTRLLQKVEEWSNNNRSDSDVRDRLFFRIHFYGAHVYMKMALSHADQSNTTEYYGCLHKSKIALEQCKSYGSFYAESKDIGDLVKYLEARLLGGIATRQTHQSAEDSGGTSSSTAQKRQAEAHTPGSRGENPRKHQKRARTSSQREKDILEENSPRKRDLIIPSEREDVPSTNIIAQEIQQAPGHGFPTFGSSTEVQSLTKADGDQEVTDFASDSEVLRPRLQTAEE